MAFDLQNDPVVAQMAPLIRALAGPGRVAFGIGGSRAKGRTDLLSDYDFRLYADRWCADDLRRSAPYAAFAAAMAGWAALGIAIDGTWPRLIGVIDAEVDQWLAGTARPTPLDWAIWGYHLPTDLVHQMVIDDPDGVMAGWKARLAAYPDALRARILTEELAVLRYWAGDYHYASKVARGDVVFLAGLTSRLVHAILQVVFALNRRWFPGDGWLLAIVEGLPVQPADLAPRITAILTARDHAAQRLALIALIQDLDALAAKDPPDAFPPDPP
jgi:hypothetical protein